MTNNVEQLAVRSQMLEAARSFLSSLVCLYPQTEEESRAKVSVPLSAFGQT